MSIAIITSRTRRQHGRKPSWPYSINRGSPQAQGLAYWWPGDPAGGKTLFELVRGSDGTLTNGPAWVPGPEGGMVIDGDATDDYIVFPQTGFANPSSVFWWFRPDDTSAGDRRAVGVAAGSVGGFIRQNGTVLQALDTGGGTWTTIVSGIEVGWQHVGAVYLGSGSCTGYRNGNPGSTAGSTTPTIWQSQPWTYGAAYLGAYGSYFGACIHDLRIYRTEVPASTIAAMYDPATRWDLYYQPGRRAFSLPGVTPGGLLLRLQTEGLFVGGVM